MDKSLLGRTALKYRADIDGLRAVAVLSVLAFHAELSRSPGGFVGVDVFFVISGYLISSIVFSEIAASRFSVISFPVDLVVSMNTSSPGTALTAAIAKCRNSEQRLHGRNELHMGPAARQFFYGWSEPKRLFKPGACVTKWRNHYVRCAVAAAAF
jgi:hypothetical protein